jgi:hypothetical protein
MRPITLAYANATSCPQPEPKKEPAPQKIIHTPAEEPAPKLAAVEDDMATCG